MILRRLRSKIGLVCLVVVLTGAPVAAKDKWINLITKNFNIVSNADDGSTRKLAMKLEQFHFAFSSIFKLPLERSIKTTVIVFRNESSFNPYKPIYNGKPGNVAGYFQGGEDENLIVMDISANQERPMSVIYHEYTHLLASSTPRDWPLWLKEGLAELYSSFDVFNGMVLLGLPIPRHVVLLRQKTLIPLKDLLSVGHGSPLYNERDRQGIFYAESWALSHYMMIGDDNARDNRMRFLVSNKEKLQFFSQDSTFAGPVKCGPVNKPAFIYFKPAAGQTKLAGDAVGIEFTRD